jgi:hypothetical protein
MQTFLAVLATLAFCWCVVVVLVGRAVRALRRTAVGWRERAELTARSHGVGPVAEAARLRRELERSLGGARRALTAARAVDAPIGDVPSLLARLELAARSVDAELRLLEAQPDRDRVAAGLTGPRSRAQAILGSAADLVDGLLHAAGHEAAELAALQAACAIEAEALRSAARGAGRSVGSGRSRRS